MIEMRAVPEDLLRVQVEASDPSISAWVCANAGSGKTHVLAQRVIRLMLAGTDPAKILCLTFTKAAAAHMANQVFDALAKWIALDEATLDRAVARMEGRPPDPAKRARARRLFALALDAPGGLKVQTIHAFCTRLLQQFPLEANVAARFSVLDARSERELLDRLQLEVLLQGAAAPGSAIGVALATALATTTDRNFAGAMAEAIGRRDQLAAWLGAAGGLQGAVAELSVMLGLGPGDTVEGVSAEILQSAAPPSGKWEAIAALLAAGQKQDRALSERLRAAAERLGPSRQQAYVDAFITSSGKPRQQLISRTLSAKNPELSDRLLKERDRLERLVRRRLAVLARDRTAALLTLASAVIERYRTEKQARGLLDYGDLIEKTLLLMRNVEAAWVHYKLDLGIDHVLIDEAQDTSPQQWEIIKKLVAEFTSGQGARQLSRTVFAVGDEKQSIFSFQGASPYEFAASRRHFERAHREACIPFVQREFKHSFRSGANVLSAVDMVFRSPRVCASVTTDAGGIPPHIALPEARPGLVEIWPCVVGKRREEVDAWDAPFDESPEASPEILLAHQIAGAVRQAIGAGRQPGDILVLVRQRGPLFEAILRALKNAGIAVSGADRLVLTEHIAVMDLLAVADALLFPADDLALATVLKSPLFGFDDDLLFNLAFRRGGTLWAELFQKAHADPHFAGTAEKLDRLARRSRSEPPFNFYARLLGQEGGRKQMRARLGREADDALDEFLNLALAYETRGPATLQGFVGWIRASAATVTRDMDIVRNEVRIMTVHGAKGHEAPMVVLADTTTKPTGPRDPRLLPLAGSGQPADAPPRFVWASTGDQDVDVMARAREAARREAEAEYHRLLYVAMTRAAEHLIVCGTQGLNGRPPGCWYDLIFEALVPQAERTVRDDGIVWRWRPGADLNDEGIAIARIEAQPIELPPWLDYDPVPAASGEQTISPSRASGAENSSRFTANRSGARENALDRGRLVHQLMLCLPALPCTSRAEAAHRHLARHAPQLARSERDDIITSVTALLDDARFAVLFGPDTRGEVSIVGRLPRAERPPLVVSGQMDRLVATDEFVLIADYKTDQPVPRRLSDVPDVYVLQLALYRAVLGRIVPGRRVRAALMWTNGPQLMELPEIVLDDALQALLAG
jgi:ATP-dependent helicase/nuclease subunit A